MIITSHSTLDELPLAILDGIEFQIVNLNGLQSFDRLDTATKVNVKRIFRQGSAFLLGLT
jgi:hypothetical protein